MTQEELKTLLDLSNSLENLAHEIEELLRSIKISTVCAKTQEKTPIN